MKCDRCNEELKPGATACHTCGRPVPPEQVVPAKKSFLSDPIAYFVCLGALLLYLLPAVASFALGGGDMASYRTVVTVTVYFRAFSVAAAVIGFVLALRSRRQRKASEALFLFATFVAVFCITASLATFATGAHLFLSRS